MAPVKRFGSVRRLSSGRWQARYTHEARESKAPRTFATQSEAETWLRIKRTELETGSQLLIRAKRTAGVTLANYSDEWLRERDSRRAPASSTAASSTSTSCPSSASGR